MKRVGILGSTFNPPHYGHLRLAKSAISFLSLDEIILVPTAYPPHKAIEEIWGYEMRVLMAGVAFFVWSPEELEHHLKPVSVFSSSDINAVLTCYHHFYNPDVPCTLWEIEKKKQTPSYTVETLQTYRQHHPNDEVYLLIGQDQAAVFSTWKEYEKIFTLAKVCVAHRPGNYLLPDMPFLLLPSFEEKVSSSLIRKAWLAHQPFEEFVPPWVAILLKKLQPTQ